MEKNKQRFKMKIRNNIISRKFPEAFFSIGVLIFLPIVFIYDIMVILPAVYEPYEFMYVFTYVLAMFLMFNIKSNLLSCLLTDTSFDFDILKPPNNAVADHGWRLCAKCDHRLAPPRSWHCKTCNTCILKRDHHCTFTGCCVGHENHRYFLMFSLYLLIGSTYSLVYQIYYFYILHHHLFFNVMTLVKIVCPLLLAMHGDVIFNIPLIFHSLNGLAFIVSAGVFCDQLYLLYYGGVGYDRKIKFPYNRGFKRNLQGVLGKRFYLVWISPFIKSDLPDDGITWVKDNIKTD